MKENKRSSVFRNRNFVLTFLGAAVSDIGALLYSFAVGFWILELTGNNAIVQGIYLAVTGLTFVLFSPVGGVICDRSNLAKVMYVCDYLRGSLILAGSLTIFLINDADTSVVILFIIGVLGNVIGAVFSPASGALLPRIVEEDSLQQANSFFSFLNSFQSVIGMVLAAVLYAALPTPVLFGVVGVCYLMSGFSEMFIRYAYEKREGVRLRSAVDDLKGGFGYVLGSKPLRALLLVIIFVNFFFAPITQNFISYFIKTDVAGHDYIFSSLLTPESWNSVFGFCIGLASMISALILSARKRKEKIGGTVRFWLLMVSILFLGLATTYYVLVARGVSLNAFLITLCAGCFMTGLMLVNINVPTGTKMQLIVDKDMLGKVTAIKNMCVQGLIPISVFLAGLVITYLGTAGLLFICGGGLLAVSLAAYGIKAFDEM